MRSFLPSPAGNKVTAPGPAPEPMAICSNCNAPNVEAFCPRCGQERGTPVGPLKEIVRDAAEQFLQWDGRLMQTLKGLLRPGFLTTEYLAGRRVAYITPFRLYLWASALYLLAFSMTTQKEMQALLNQPTVSEQMQQGIEQGRRFGGKASRTRITPEPPSSRAVQVEKRALTRIPIAAKWVEEHLGFISMALLPFYAGFLQLLYRRQRPHYIEQFLTILHNETAMLLINTPLLFIPSTQNFKGFLPLGIYPVYYFLSLRQIYGGYARQTVAKTVLKMVLYFVAVVLLLALASFAAGLLIVLLP